MRKFFHQQLGYLFKKISRFPYPLSQGFWLYRKFIVFMLFTFSTNLRGINQLKIIFI